MKKLLIAAAVAATFVTPQAFAQAKNFEGFSIAANLNLANSTTDVTSTIFNGGSTESGQNLGLQGQYNIALSPSFVLGMGVGLNLGDLNAGTLLINGVTVTVKQKTGASVYVAPGFAVSDSTLVYGKLAGISGNFEASGTSTSTSTVSGVGFGFGFQSYLSKNTYLQAEVIQNNYADRSFASFSETDKNKSTVLSIGLGYKF